MLQSGSHGGSLSLCLGLRMIPVPLLSETHETRHETAVGLSARYAPADLPTWETVLTGFLIPAEY